MKLTFKLYNNVSMVNISKPRVKWYIDTVTRNAYYSFIHFLLAYNIVVIDQYGDTVHESIYKS